MSNYSFFKKRDHAKA
jgi:hypothetical protein